jgi:hypothetical protein
MRNQLLDDIHLINEEIENNILRKRLLAMALISFFIVLIVRFFFRDSMIIETESIWLIDFMAVSPLLNAMVINSAFTYYVYYYRSESKWNFASFFISFIEFVLVMLLSRVILYGFFGPILLVALGINIETEELGLFYGQGFWIDIIPLFTDILLVFYFFNPIPKTKEQK